MADPVSAEILPAPEIMPARGEAETAARRSQIKAVPPPAPAPSGYDLLSETIAKAQDMARQTALQIADDRLQAARSLLGLQQSLLEMAHANMTASFAAAQQIVGSTSLGDALAIHKRYAQDQVATLTRQASELRTQATKLTGQSAEPWADYWTKSFARIRKSFEA